MKLIQLVLAILLCVYVGESWRLGEKTFTVVPGFDIPFWLAIPIAAICLIGSIKDLASGPARR